MLQAMRQNKYHLKVFIISVLVMTVYESLKELFFQDFSKWQSHVVTVLVVSCGVLFASYFFRKKAYALRLASTVFDIVDDAVAITDQNNRIISINPSFTKITGYSLEEVRDRDPKVLSSSRHLPEFYDEMWNTLTTTGAWNGEIWNRRKNGEIFIEWLSIKRVYDENGNLTHHVAVFSDITERKASAERLEYLAHHDILTNLPNRILFSDRLQQAIANAKRENRHIAVLYLDLDKFKPINDMFGHDCGDQLLKEVSLRLLECVREADTVSRVGGDEFLVLLPAIGEANVALLVAEKIRHALGREFHLSDHRLLISASIGIAIYPEHGSSEAMLLKNADTAMYETKSNGGNGVKLYQVRN